MDSAKGKLKIFESPDTLNREAAEFIIQLAQESIASRGKFVLALSGGRTPGELYSLLATPAYSNRVNWRHTFIFWGDERCVPLNDQRNNAFVAKRLLLDHINIPPANIFRIPVNYKPAEAAIQYEKNLKDFFGADLPSFDLVLLGLGENGHTASLFPGSVVLKDKKHLVKEVYVDEQKMFRITMTATLINQARNIAFLVSGKEKAEILVHVFSNTHNPDKYPVQLIKPRSGNLFWFIDKAAAVFLNIR